MMMSSKCLDLGCLELFSCIFFRREYNSLELFFTNLTILFQLFRMIFIPSCEKQYFRKRLKQIFHIINKEPIVTLRYNVMMTSSKCLDLDSFKLLSCVSFRRKYYSRRLKNIFDGFDSETIVTPGYIILMVSSKCLGFNSFEVLFSDTIFRSNNFS